MYGTLIQVWANLFALVNFCDIYPEYEFVRYQSGNYVRGNRSLYLKKSPGQSMSIEMAGSKCQNYPQLNMYICSIWSFHVVVLQRTVTKCTKVITHVQSYCTAH